MQKPTDTWIYLKEFKIDAVSLGVYESEHQQLQPVIFDIAMQIDSQIAATSDDLAFTVDYTQVLQTIVAIAQSRHFQLIESMLHAVAEAILGNYPIKRLRLTLHKPQALTQARVSIAIDQQREAADLG